MKMHEFMSGLKTLENMYEHSFNQSLVEILWKMSEKWRVETWNKIISRIIETFKPTAACKVPVPSDFISAKNDINSRIDYFERPKTIPETPEDIAGHNEYKKLIAELLTKWNNTKKKKGIGTSHFEGIYICEACHRKGCGGSEGLEKCYGFLSEKDALEINNTTV
jgi:hypothetical protein